MKNTKTDYFAQEIERNANCTKALWRTVNDLTGIQLHYQITKNKKRDGKENCSWHCLIIIM